MMELDGWCCLDLATVGNSFFFLPTVIGEFDWNLELELELELEQGHNAEACSLFLASLAYFESMGVKVGEWRWMVDGWVMRLHRLTTKQGWRWKGYPGLAYFVHEWSKKEELAMRKEFDPGSPMGWTLVDVGPLPG